MTDGNGREQQSKLFTLLLGNKEKEEARNIFSVLLYNLLKEYGPTNV
jgi:hypothetical protein